jgi:peptidoglycan/LPS O-acetylase OafA/YrhL
MNKKVNTAIFMIVATVVNLLFVIGFAILGLVIFGKLFSPTSADAGIGMPIALFALCFILPVVLSWLLYNFILKLLSRKFNLEDKLAPIFNRKRRPPRQDDMGSPSVKG